MRSYIFTHRERRILQQWLRGLKVDGIILSKVLYRFRSFKAIEGDVELYLAVRERLKAKPSKTVST
jgi:hypothetical protein